MRGSIFVSFVVFFFICLFVFSLLFLFDFLISVTLSPSVFALYIIFKTIYYRSFETATMNKFKSGPYLNSSISHISPEPRSKATVWKLVTSNILMSLSASLCSDTFDNTYLPHVNLNPLIGVAMPCYPGSCSSMTGVDVQTRSVRSVFVVVRRRGPKMTRQDSSVFHAHRHDAPILTKRTESEFPLCGFNTW